MIRTRDRFEKNIFYDTVSGCWLWSGPEDRGGYGLFWLDGKCEKAHRVNFQLHNGKITDGLHVLHSCDVRLCVNPDHLRLGTNQENMKDKTDRGRHHNQKKTHCPKGHPYKPENTKLYRGRRKCLRCANYWKKEIT